MWIFAPSGTPGDVVRKLSDAIVAQTQTQGFKDLCRNQGLEVDPQDAATVKAAGPGVLEKWRVLMSAVDTKAN